MKKTLSAIVLAVLMVVAVVLPVCAAANATPSVTVKMAPDVVSAKVAGTALTDQQIWATAYADRAVKKPGMTDAISATTKTDLEKAYDEINGTASLSTLCPDLDAAAKEISAELNGSCYTVFHLFDLSVADAVKANISASNPLEVSLKFNKGTVDPSTVVMHRDSATGKWLMLDKKDVQVSADGTVAMKFPSLCPVALLRAVPEKNNPGSPATGVRTAGGILLAVAGASVLGFALVGRKKHN